MNRDSASGQLTCSDMGKLNVDCAQSSVLRLGHQNTNIFKSVLCFRRLDVVPQLP